jgi:hypothetical protein
MTAKLLVVNLQIRLGSTTLASPAISTQHQFLESRVEVGVKRQGAVAWVESRSRRFLYFVQKSLPLFTREESEKPCHGLQEHRRVLIVEVRSCQEVGTDHLQAIASRLVRSQHQSRGLNRLLDYRNLGLV